MTQIEIKTIEDCVKLLINTHSVELSDQPVMHSILRQNAKKVALTDRQYNMLKHKMEKYSDLINQYTSYELAINNLDFPLRTVDRSKTIKISELPSQSDRWNKVDSQLNSTWIEICFPFHKKTIYKIQELAKAVGSQLYFHKNNSRSHFFALTEKTVVPIVGTFRNRNFDIDKEIIDFYNLTKEIESSPQDFIPMFDQGHLINVKQKVLDLIPNSVIQDPAKLFDRRRRYGITDQGVEPQLHTLKDRVVFRESTDFLSNPDEHSLQSILETVYELDRYPMVVVMDERRAEEHLHEVYNELKTYIDNTQQSVLFRQEGDTEFNQFVKDKNLNNWVDNNTKIVYINTNKLPKVMLTSNFKPITCFMFGSTANRYVDTYIQDHCDLIIYRDTEMSPMRKYSTYYGNL